MSYRPEESPNEKQEEPEKARLDRLYREYKASGNRETLGEMFTICERIGSHLVQHYKIGYKQAQGVRENDFDETVEKVLFKLVNETAVDPRSFTAWYIWSLRNALSNVGRSVNQAKKHETNFTSLGQQHEEGFKPELSPLLLTHDQPPVENTLPRHLKVAIMQKLHTIKPDTLRDYIAVLEGKSYTELAEATHMKEGAIRERVCRVRERLNSIPNLDEEMDGLSPQEKGRLALTILDSLKELLAQKEQGGKSRSRM